MSKNELLVKNPGSPAYIAPPASVAEFPVKVVDTDLPVVFEKTAPPDSAALLPVNVLAMTEDEEVEKIAPP